MNYSEAGKKLTEQFEGLRLGAYQDQGGVWTCGYGHTAGVGPETTCTPEQADEWLDDDIAWAVDFVNRVVCVELTQGQFDALVDFTFNLGAGAFKGSTLLAYVNNHEFTAAAAEFGKWVYVAGKQSAGLVRRRQAEKELFTS